MNLKHFVETYKTDLENVALAVRILGMDMVLKSKSGHVGLPLGGAEMGVLTYFALMNHNPQNPQWVDRDRFVLSAGHGSALQYALLHLAGYDVSVDDLKAFRQWGSTTPGHPEFGHTSGVECTTGPLGQGVAMATGMALCERMLAARLNDSPSHNASPLIDHRTYVLAGDGCLMEGVSAEASSLAGHLKLNRLILMYDANNITIDGTIDVAFGEDVAKRYEAYGFSIFHADGNSFESLAAALDQAYTRSQLPNGEAGPSLIVCRTLAGKGSPKWEGKPKIHGNPMSAEDVIDTKKHLGVENTEPFFIPEKCLISAQKLIKIRCEKEQKWNSQCQEQKHLWEKHHSPKRELWNALLEDSQNQGLSPEDFANAQGKMATRQASGKALAALAQLNPKLVGGSADLAGSNLTTLPNTSFVTSTNFEGRNIHFGVREHAMGAICNGITLHGGLQAYCATFLVFSDYMRPAIRLAALMKVPTLFIFTHDSYGVGEDGPTHQPIEHVDALRLIPQLNVFRPADTLETYAAWNKAALSTLPSALLFTRQDVSDLNTLTTPRSLPEFLIAFEKGAVLLKNFAQNSDHKKQIILTASGSEVEIVLKAALLLEAQGWENVHKEKTHLTVRVVSCPCPQDVVKAPFVLNTLFPKDITTYALEATRGVYFAEIVGRSGAVFALHQFGASAPYTTLSQKLGFTEEKFAQFVLNQLHLRPAKDL
jgi:transketolase